MDSNSEKILSLGDYITLQESIQEHLSLTMWKKVNNQQTSTADVDNNDSFPITGLL